MSTKTNAKGFTIIEVVLVLAIAGLIFLVVFLALPALQRGQRDSQRKSDVSRLLSQITAYQSNRQGNLPSDWSTGAQFYTGYLTANGQTFRDPSTNTDYGITTPSLPAPTASPPAPTAGQIFIYPSAKCDASVNAGLSAITPTSNRIVAAVIHQEQGGMYCQGNN